MPFGTLPITATDGGRFSTHPPEQERIKSFRDLDILDDSDESMIDPLAPPVCADEPASLLCPDPVICEGCACAVSHPSDSPDARAYPTDSQAS